jgi:transposase
MSHVTVYSGTERRRRWSHADRQRILEEAFAPGACVAAVARRYEISSGLLYTWRGKLRQQSAPAFSEVVVSDVPRSRLPETTPWIFVDLAGGVRVSIAAAAPPTLAAAVLRALR